MEKVFEEGKYVMRALVTSDFVSDDCLLQVEGTAAYD